uniref:Transmembrane protein n=1 Tax=Neospora caninum (strain Liverpool) TaxID=572307 RepID=F0JB70_NEOCL|nr:hypothetical protein, conserved [Neospora caninum Liverpool]CEL71337.1 TPA: hypothetical protein, conserved [Neospora caninum Liverpool]
MPCCATACALLSGFAIVFLLVFGALMSSKATTIEIDHDKMENGSVAAFICAGAYGVFLVISCLYLYLHASRRAQNAPPEAVPLQSMAEAGSTENRPQFDAEATPEFSSQSSQKLAKGRTTSGTPAED